MNYPCRFHSGQLFILVLLADCSICLNSVFINFRDFFALNSLKLLKSLDLLTMLSLEDCKCIWMALISASLWLWMLSGLLWPSYSFSWIPTVFSFFIYLTLSERSNGCSSSLSNLFYSSDLSFRKGDTILLKL